MPVSGARFCKSCDTASNPPADAPIATTVKGLASFSNAEIGVFLGSFVFFASLALDAVSFLETTFFIFDFGVDFIFSAIFNEGYISFVVKSKSIWADLIPSCSI